MVDIVDPATRSRIMARVRAKDTGPELLVRRALHAKGFRFRLHRKGLPGKPDLVFPKYNAVIFVHGCFWHGHSCRLYRLPKTRPEFWEAKIGGNRSRDGLAVRALGEMGWRVLIVWECAFRGKSLQSVDNVVQFMSDWLRSESIFEEIGDR